MPLDHGVDREGVAQVVNARPAGTGLRVETDVAHQPAERPIDVLVEEPRASQGNKERRLGSWPALVAELRVLRERLDRAGVERQLAGRSELAVADRKAVVGPVQIISIQGD